MSKKHANDTDKQNTTNSESTLNSDGKENDAIGRSRIPKAKIIPPHRAASCLVRQCITDYEQELDSCKLVVIQAPAGFGKTTAMMQFVEADRRMGNAVAWISLDDNDNDVSRFLRGFTLAMANANPDIPLPGTSSSRNAELADWIIDTIEAANNPTSIYFDNFEVLRNPVVIGLIQSGTNSLPPGSRCIVASRRSTDLSLSKLRARGQLIELNSDDLRFTREETSTYLCSQRGVDLNSDQLEHLYSSTEGWAVALWLASLALQGRSDTNEFINSFSGSNAAVASYLAEDVLSALPTDLQKFLLQISILNDIREDLCNVVCQRDDSLALLQQLYHQNLFVTLTDEQQQVYSFHALFHDFLSNQLDKEYPHEVQALHARAAEAYLASNCIIPAIRHSLKAELYSKATGLIREHATRLLNDGRLRLLAGFLDYFPRTEIDKHPDLKLLKAWCVTFTVSPREALRIISELNPASLSTDETENLIVLKPMLLGMMDHIEEGHKLGLDALQIVNPSNHFARAMLSQALTQTSIILGEHDAARSYVDHARRSQSDGGGTFGAVLAESAEGLLDLMKGHLKQATQHMRHAMETFAASRNGDRRGISLAAIQLGEALYEADELTEASKLLSAYAPLVQDIGPADALISAHVIQARILFETDADGALDLLSELENRGHALHLPRVVASARLQRATFWLSNGDIDGSYEQIQLAEQCFDWPDLNNRWYIANDSLTPQICRLRWTLRSGKVGAALPKLRDALKEAERTQHVRRALKLRILLAEAQHQDGQRNMALRTMGRAVRMANDEGFIRTFLEEGPKVTSLLREMQTHGSEADFSLGTNLEQHLSQVTQPSATAGNMPSDPLTPKELQVLALLAEGLSNIAMSERLFVSESTVRTHLRSINLKLNAANRTEAVVIARRNGLVT
jgi:LuxR family transcriptional regulator, maltose regulon positive regulatory protein